MGKDRFGPAFLFCSRRASAFAASNPQPPWRSQAITSLLGRNPIFVLWLEAERRFAILAAAQRENREHENSVFLGSE
jgi:hypothetical protein